MRELLDSSIAGLVRAYRSRRGIAGRDHARDGRAGRAGESAAQCALVDPSGRGAGERCGVGGAMAARQAARTARWRAGHDQGQHPQERLAVAAWYGSQPESAAIQLRCTTCSPPRRSRRGDARQDRDARFRAAGVGRQLRLRHRAQSLADRCEPGRLERRGRGVAGGGHRLRVGRQRHRRLGSAAGIAMRAGGAQADPGQDSASRTQHDAVGRPDGAQRGRCRSAADGAGRGRSARYAGLAAGGDTVRGDAGRRGSRAAHRPAARHRLRPGRRTRRGGSGPGGCRSAGGRWRRGARVAAAVRLRRLRPDRRRAAGSRASGMAELRAGRSGAGPAGGGGLVRAGRRHDGR